MIAGAFCIQWCIVQNEIEIKIWDIVPSNKIQVDNLE